MRIIAKRRIAGWMLLMVLVFSVTVVFHTEIDGRYRPNCPACQLEHNPALHTSGESSASAVAAPVVLFLMHTVPDSSIRLFFTMLEPDLRSPPVCFV
jgi:hypothetical protein